jgi:type II secretory pathway pseudopilin PulG
MRNKTLPIERKKIVCGGFTLTELSIVFSIIGALIGGIWVAANGVYTKYQVDDLMREIQTFQQNVRTVFSSTPTSQVVNENLTDSCGRGPCSTNLMLRMGAFAQDFVNINSAVSGNSYGTGGNLYTTKYGYVIWTGIEDSSVYANQFGCGGPRQPCPKTSTTIVELDLFNLPTPICSQILMKMVNAKIDNLIGISTTVTGWGPVTALYTGNPTLPSSMSLQTASNACVTGGQSEFSYDASAKPQIWMWFSND